MDEKQMLELGCRAGLFVLGSVAGAMAVGVARRVKVAVLPPPSPKLVVLIGDPSAAELSSAVLGEADAGNILLGVPRSGTAVESPSAGLREMWDAYRESLIRRADEVLVVNGGEELEGVARGELGFAESMGKVVRWSAPNEYLERVEEAPTEPEGGVDEFRCEPPAGGRFLLERTAP